MTKRNNRLTLAQNFLKNPSYVRYLLSLSSLTDRDRVLEIGAGRGIITHELANVVQRVTALEIDKHYFETVQESTADLPHVTCKRVDILRYRLPSKPYKVFSNIPFNLTAEIIEKLLGSAYGPTHAYLILQKEAAEKFVVQRGSTEASALWQPWYAFTLLTTIERTQFQPTPSIDAALLGIERRTAPLLAQAARPEYARFVSFAFRAWKKDLKTAFRNVFTHAQWKRLAKDGRFPLHAKPSDLNTTQWLHIFNYFQTGVAPEKKKQFVNP